MGEAALATSRGISPKVIKISSKRQITIPADMYEKLEFSSYAFVTVQEDGSLSISPIDVHDEASSVKILRSLLEQGLDGSALVDEYERIVSATVDYKAAINQGLEDFKEGRVRPFEAFRDEIRQSYDI